MAFLLRYQFCFFANFYPHRSVLRLFYSVINKILETLGIVGKF